MLNRLTRRGIIGWRSRSLHIADRERLAQIAGAEPQRIAERPYL